MKILKKLFTRMVMHFTLLRIMFYRDINVGDEFTFNEFEKKDPFKDPPARVKVKAVKKGFVNYEHIGSSLWKNESMRVSHFNYCYIPDAK